MKLSQTLLDKGKVRVSLLRLHIGKTLVGQCKLYFTSDHSAILGDLIIYKRFRGKGHGSVLLSEILKKNLSIMLWVADTNIAAQNLYLKHGFKKIGFEPNQIIMFRKPK